MDRDAQEKLASGLAQRIYNRSRIHPQGNQEGEQNLQVTILGSHGRDDGTEAQRKACQHHDDHWEKECIPSEMSRAIRIKDGVEDIHNRKESELNTKLKEITDYSGDRHYQSRKIHFSKDSRIRNKRIRCTHEAAGEVGPGTGSCQIEQWPRDPIRRNTGNTTEHNHVHDNRQSRLNHEP